MNNIFSILSLLLVLFSLCSCGENGTSSSSSEGDTIRLKYAENLTIVRHEGYTTVKLSDPWNEGATLHTYILVPTEAEMPANLPSGTVIRTPLKRAVVATSVHCGLVVRLGRGESIKGTCDVMYINQPWIHERIAAGEIIDCGNGITPTLEKIIECDADAIIISPFQNSGGYGRLHEWGKPIIEAADYMETSALGRAEWMRFYGMLFGAESEADSLFADVERRYEELKALAAKSSVRRSLLMDKMNGSMWYVPGGRSTLGGIIADAGMDYPFASYDNSGGVPLPFETVLEKAGSADVWMTRCHGDPTTTYASLLSENPGYSQFKAFKDKAIYVCNTNRTTFYEDTPFRPDMLLRDFIIIAHPDLKDLGETTYFEKMR